MKFVISKTENNNQWNEDNDETTLVMPCPDAKLEKVDRVEVRTIYNEDEFDKRFGKNEGKWRSKGVNHGFDDRGYICRVFPASEEVYTVNISTIESLMNLIEHCEHPIVVNGCGRYGLPEIEIYNGYRE